MNRTYLKKDKGKWWVVTEFSRYDEPIILRMWWDTGMDACGDRFQELDGSLLDCRGNGRYITRKEKVMIFLPGGGKQQAGRVDKEEYPCPRVKKGIETKYESGEWFKYLKSKGWVPA